MQNQKIIFHSDIIQWIVSLPSPLLNAEGWAITVDACALRIITSMSFVSQHNSNLRPHCIAAHRQVYCCSLAMAGNKGPCGRSAAPSPTGVGKRMERKWQKLMGEEKDSLTEQQMK